MRASVFLAASVILGGVLGLASSAQAGPLANRVASGAFSAVAVTADHETVCVGPETASCFVNASTRSKARSASQRKADGKPRFKYRFKKSREAKQDDRFNRSREAKRDEFRKRRLVRRSNNYYYVIDRFGRRNDGFIYLARPRPETLSCSKVRYMLRNAGWRISASLDCKGERYSFRGFHGSSRYVVLVDAVDGRVIERRRS